MFHDRQSSLRKMRKLVPPLQTSQLDYSLWLALGAPQGSLHLVDEHALQDAQVRTQICSEELRALAANVMSVHTVSRAVADAVHIFTSGPCEACEDGCKPLKENVQGNEVHTECQMCQVQRASTLQERSGTGAGQGLRGCGCCSQLSGHLHPGSSHPQRQQLLAGELAQSGVSGDGSPRVELCILYI